MALTPEQNAEIAALRATPRPTLRAVSEGMERHLYLARPVLDHGFVRVIDYMGDDAAIVQAARVSYGAGTKHVQNDEGLIRYLMRHWHSTPFEMCEIKLHVKLPVFVARQWIRHRTANVNEYSARYSILDREFYIPAPDALAAQSTVNNQGRGEVLEGEEAARVLEMLKSDAARAYDTYEAMLQPGRPAGARARARADEPARERLHAMVLENRPPQPVPLPAAPRGRPRAIRDPGLRREHSRGREGLGALPPTGRSRTTAWAARPCRRRRWTACGGCSRGRR